MSGEEKAGEVLWSGRHLEVVRRGRWECVTRRNGRGIVGIVAVTADRRIVLVEQHRPPVQGRTIELPAGLAGDVRGEEDEAFETAARRELLEETGYTAGAMERLCEGTLSAGLSDEVMTLFLARDVVRTGDGGGDAHEDIVVHVAPVDGILEWLAKQSERGLLVDAKVFAGLYFLNCGRR